MIQGDVNWSGGHLNDPDWWWEVAFDGIAGAVLGTLAVAFVLWRTIKHERRLDDTRRAREAAARLQAVAWRLSRALNEELDDDEQMDLMIELRVVLNEFIAALTGHWEHTVRQAIDLYEETIQDMVDLGADPISGVLLLADLALEWLKNPETEERYAAKDQPPFVRRVVARIDADRLREEEEEDETR